MKTTLLDQGNFALGLVCGICLTSIAFLFYDYYDIIVSDKTLLGAIIGGGIAGLASLCTALVAVYFSIKDSQEKKKHGLASSAFSAFQKSTELLDTITKTYHHFFTADETSIVRAGKDTLIWKPLHGVRDRVQFSESEKCLGLQIKRADLFNMIQSLQRLEESFSFLRLTHDEHFRNFQSTVQPQLRSDLVTWKGSGPAKIDNTQMIELLSVQGLLKSFLLDAQKEAKRLHALLIEILEREFGTTVNFELVNVKPSARDYFAPAGR
ncbi:hypothetical protein JYP51_15810 [Ponticoccus gilvus]|nr:hypothetical protein [Enemella evansiae]